MAVVPYSIDLLAGNVTIHLLQERYNNVIGMSKIINENMAGNFYQFIKHLTSDKKLFDVIVKNFPCFQDEREYNGKTIYFYKIAQLLTYDILYIRMLKEGIEVDLSHLIGCADYKIPQVLRGLGILVYDEELSVEIRSSMIVVIDRIKQLLNNKYNSIDINGYIYSQKKNKELTSKPYHLTRTTNY